MHTIVLVPVYESERCWGSKIDDHMACLSNESADEFIKNFNSVNNEKTVPDWYMYASNEKTYVDVTDEQYNKLKSLNRLWWSALKVIEKKDKKIK